MFEMLPFYYEEMRRWDKSFRNGTSCDDQMPGDMQPKPQKKKSDPCASVVDASLLVYGRHFQQL